MPEFLDNQDQRRAERLEAMRGWWSVFAAQAHQIVGGKISESCNTAVDEFCKKFDVKLWRTP